jgi:hypothetical protein
MPRDFANEKELEFLLPSAKAPSPPATDDVLSNLIAARAFIAREEDWCVGDRGHPGHGPRCALGALDAVFGRYCAAVHQQEVKLLARFAKYQLGDEIPFWGTATHEAMCVAQHNNQFGHAATLEMFDRAIAARAAELNREG